MQWFYFSVKNNKKCKVKFNIFRFRKCYSLFQRGFRPYVRSRRAGGDWAPGGDRVKYYRQMSCKENGVKKPTNFYYLSFYYTFQHQNDEVLMAACIPYTVTYLEDRLSQLDSSLNSQLIKYQVKPLCTSVCGQQIDVITFEPRESHLSSLQRQFIIINARSHPGETSSSWVADGLLETLLGDEGIHQWMVRMNICFRIVPMLNKDGVFIGNYRTGIVGEDFNRKFNSGQKELFPEILGLKQLVRKCQKAGKVKLFLDLHGHSVLRNSFIFGPDKRSYEDEDLIRLGDILAETSLYFSHGSSRYINQKGKIQTARVYFQLAEEILSLTCENSLGLYFDQSYTYQHKSSDWKAFGAHLIKGIQLCFQIPRPHLKLTAPMPSCKTSRTIDYGTSTKKGYSCPKNINNDVLKKKNSLLASPKKPIVFQGQRRQVTVLEEPSSKESKTKMGPELPWALSKRKSKQLDKERRLKQHKVLETALQKSIILTRYPQSKSINEDRTAIEMRASKTSHQQSISLKYSLKQAEELFGVEEVLPDNFSEGYQSINDLDSEEEDIPESKKQELFKSIKQLNIKSGNVAFEDYLEGTNTLIPLKGFKQYKFSYQNMDNQSVERKPLNSKLKPLKYQQFKTRDLTEKRIKRNMDVLFTNHSCLPSEREKARMLLSKNQISSKVNKAIKKEQVMSEIFPHLEEQEYLMMRIREMKLQNQKEGYK